MQFLLPIFLLFVLAHGVAITLGVGTRIGELPTVVSGSIKESVGDVHGIGLWATLAILLHAYSLGGGTYTGIEAVSNGLQISARTAGRDRKKNHALYGDFSRVYRQWDFTLLPAAPGCPRARQDFERQPA